MKFSQILDQNRVKKILTGAIRNDRISGAYLFLGPDEGVLKDMAFAFTSALNCEKKGQESCGECRSCKKIDKGIHPDVFAVSPDGSNIKIDQIRELISYTKFGPAEARFKVCVIADASSMTTEAANAFLKTLEEPVSNVLFILLAANDVGIPRTVVSRCQRILFPERSIDEMKRNYSDLGQDIEWIYSALNDVPPAGFAEALDVSSRIYDSTDDLARTLEALMDRMWQGRDRSSNWKAVSAVISALSALKKRANARLALDLMCLRLGECNVR
jgi:DNA polymerase III delta' subunit